MESLVGLEMKDTHLLLGDLKEVRWPLAIEYSESFKILPSLQVIRLLSLKLRTSQIEDFGGRRDEVGDSLHL